MVQHSGPNSTPPKGLAGLPQHVAAPNPEIYYGDNYVVLDFETTNLLKGNPVVDENRIVLACWSEPARGGSADATVGDDRTEVAGESKIGRVRRWIRGGEYDCGELVRAIERADYIVAHNAKFELGWLARCGLDLRSVLVYDTQIAEYVLGGNRYMMSMLGLDACLKRWKLDPKVSVPSLMLKAEIPTEDIPEHWLLEYCMRDVDACEELFLLQRDRLKERGLLHLQYSRCLLTPVLADVESNGMQLDPEQVEKFLGNLEDEYAQFTTKLQDLMEGASPTSVKAKREFVYGKLGFSVPTDHKGNEMRTSKGDASVAADVLEKLRPKTKEQTEWLEKYMEFTGMHSDLTKYLRKFKECCEVDGGRLHAQFNQCQTKTHRLSSSGLTYKVQFQNLNRKFKPIFTARHEGWLMGEADGAQLEFRVAVHMGADQQGYEDIVHDVDIHSYTASVIGCSRQDAKVHTFKPLYGGKSGTVAQRRYYDDFSQKYAGIAATQRQWARKCVDHKKFRTEYGLIAYFPGCEMSTSGWVTYTNQIYNLPVQGFATAEIIPLAVVCAWHRMKDMESFLVNTVHDSIIAEIHPEEVDLWHELSKQCLIRDVYKLLADLYGISFTVPLGAGVMIGTHWASKEAKAGEVTYNAPPELYEEAWNERQSNTAV